VLPRIRHQPQTTFTQTFALSKAKPQVATAAINERDRAGIARQQVCPVTGAKLGSMGAPTKVMVGSQTLYLCCAACLDTLKEDPEQYQAKAKPGTAKK
jgi:YHS domain-containing protein